MNDLSPKFPEIVQLSLTNKCQCHCKHCGVSHLNKKVDCSIPLSDIAEIFRDLKVSGTKVVDLFGGEPTLRQDLLEIIKMGNAAGLMMIIETNGILLDEKYVAQLESAGLGRVYLSMDSHIEEIHDEIRGFVGAFQKSLLAMRNCRNKIPVHVSIVPRDIDYFKSGDFNTFLDLCFMNGAEKVRVLFPSCIGNQKDTEQEHIARIDERKIFDYIAEKYRDKVYVEAEHNILGEESECSAKKMFCHITNNGLVFPCAYFPIAFGDIRNESITTIFHRMQSHPIMDDNDKYCPTRNLSFIKEYLSDITKDNPYVFVKSKNKIFFGNLCNNSCTGCFASPNGQKRKKEEIIEEIIAAKGYKTLDLYGGEFLSRPDFHEITGHIDKNVSVNIYCNGRVFASVDFVRRISSLVTINSVKINLFSLNPKEYDSITNIPGSFKEVLNGIVNLVRNKIPVCIYIPENKFNQKMMKNLIALGIVSVSTYVSEPFEDISEISHSDTVSCFGRDKILSEKLLWLRR